jgi:thioredoxin 1
MCSREDFKTILLNNPGFVVLKVGADWCKPCKLLAPILNRLAPMLPSTVQYLELDVDTDLGSFLKSKKQIVGIPVLLAYKQGNYTPYADQSLTGPTEAQVVTFFSGMN